MTVKALKWVIFSPKLYAGQGNNDNSEFLVTFYNLQPLTINICYQQFVNFSLHLKNNRSNLLFIKFGEEYK